MNVAELDIEKCSGCGLCAKLCSERSIIIIPNELGYLHPTVDKNTCIDCSLCVKMCVIANPHKLVNPQKTYAAIREDKEKIALSSSGGVFAAVSEFVLHQSDKWVAVGCSLDENLFAKHIVVDKASSLKRLYGSKYVQSNTTEIYGKVKEWLDSEASVLFSGTPCQVAAVQRYTKNHPRLYTMEIICHGVPNYEMFNSYLDMYDKKNIKAFYFRDKGQGWSYNNKIIYYNGNEKKINHRMSSYMTYFLKGETYRDCCYKCPYASPKRCADITIGDFWGIMQSRPDLKEKIEIEKGVSCVLVNTSKGLSLIKRTRLKLYEVEYSIIRNKNSPLNNPSTHSSNRNKILSAWAKRKNWEDVHSFWKKNDRKITFLLWTLLPHSLQHKIRVLLGKR